MKILPILFVLSLLSSCRATGMGGGSTSPGLRFDSFGTTSDGRGAVLITLRNARGTLAKLTNFGAALVELHVPDRRGEPTDIVLGFDDVSGYESEGNQYFGCTAGRVANRIANASFELDGRTFALPANDGANHLHGGELGFGRRLWDFEVRETVEGDSVHFIYRSPDGEEGYPGALTAEVIYTLTDEDALRIEYVAQAGAPTPVNLTHHSYFNLAGHGAATVLDHQLYVASARYTPTDEGLIPTGELALVAGSPLDFRRRTMLGERIAELEGTPTKGYDHNFVLDGWDGELRLAAVLRHPGSGRALEVWTTEPGLQLYSGNFLFGQRGKGGAAYAQRSAVCLEAQHFPDSVHHAQFPNTVLQPGATYQQTTEYRFSAR